MSVIHKKYCSWLDVRETEKAIKFIKDYFQVHFARSLNLSRISAPVVVSARSGVNDYLTGVERPAGFKSRALGEKVEVVQSLAKWKRVALAKYGFKPGEGLYTDMNALRPDEVLDNLHSLYVDQWDWEKIIGESDRRVECLKSVVKRIYKVICETEKAVCSKYKKLGRPVLPEQIKFIHSEELCERYPKLSPREREDAICESERAVFIIGIGAGLKDGRPHDERAADYDDWTTLTGAGMRGLNGDILVWYPVLKKAFELSSMGIRVNRAALIRQLKLKNESSKLKKQFHRQLISGKLPQTIGGGVGQSRLCMFYLRKAHIGEVQSAVWPDRMMRACKKAGINLL